MSSQEAPSSSSSKHVNLYVSGIPDSATEAEMDQVFTKFGKPKSVRIIFDHATKASKGYGFVIYELQSEADAVLKGPVVLNGKELKVEVAKGPRDRDHERDRERDRDRRGPPSSHHDPPPSNRSPPRHRDTYAPRDGRDDYARGRPPPPPPPYDDRRRDDPRDDRRRYDDYYDRPRPPAGYGAPPPPGYGYGPTRDRYLPPPPPVPSAYYDGPRRAEVRDPRDYRYPPPSYAPPPADYYDRYAPPPRGYDRPGPPPRDDDRRPLYRDDRAGPPLLPPGPKRDAGPPDYEDDRKRRRP